MRNIHAPPRTDCPSCGGPIKRLISDVRDAHYGLPGDWHWDLCQACGLWLLNPAPREDFLYSDGYDDEEYYAFKPFSEQQSFARRFASAILRYDTRRTRDPKFAAPGRLLDIGCGTGEFMFRMRQKGWNVHGLEPNRAAVRIGREHYDLDIQPGWDEADAAYADASFDYIRLNHCFEHILRPDEALRFIRRKLKDDGKLFIGVPNTDSIPARLFGPHWWLHGAPVHPHNWSARSIALVLSRNGLEIERWGTNSNFSGFLGSLQIRSNVRRGIYKDTGPLLSNPVLKIFFNTLAKTIDLFKQGDCLEVIARKSPE